MNLVIYYLFFAKKFSWVYVSHPLKNLLGLNKELWINLISNTKKIHKPCLYNSEEVYDKVEKYLK